MIYDFSDQNVKLVLQRIQNWFEAKGEAFGSQAEEMAREFNSFMKIDSTEPFSQALGNALQGVASEIYVSLQMGQDGQILALAAARINHMVYPDGTKSNEIANEPLRGMFERIIFDKLLREIGGWELVTEVMEKVRDISQTRDIFEVKA